MKIILTGNPLSTNNLYFTNPKAKYGMRFLGNIPRDRKKEYAEQAFEQWVADPLNCDIKIGIKLFFGDKRKRDWDNYHKLALDALTGIVWKDDSQIQYATVEKFLDKAYPRIELDICPVDNLDT